MPSSKPAGRRSTPGGIGSSTRSTTIYLFILQILHGNTACQHAVHFGRWNFTDSAYCAARKRLPLGVLRRLAEWIAERFRTATTAASTWHGHRVWLLDGSSFSMPDTPELQAAFGQPGGQRRGAGSRSPSSWRCSTWPPACSCGSSRRRCGRTRCRGARPPPPAYGPATSCSATAASAHTLTSPSSLTASCTGCSASTSVRSSTSLRGGRRGQAREGEGAP